MCVTKDERKLIYADNAATTKMSEAAKAAMLECMEVCFGNPSAMHPAGQKTAMKLICPVMPRIISKLRGE